MQADNRLTSDYVRRNLTRTLDAVRSGGHPAEVYRKGVLAAVVVSVAEWESLAKRRRLSHGRYGEELDAPPLDSNSLFRRWSDHLTEVLSGSARTVTRRGIPIAVLVPPSVFIGAGRP